MPPGLMLALALLGAGDDPPLPPFELEDGDRVVMIGDAFFERDHDHGLLEAALTARYPDRSITFRNLGWTGDTVWGDSRAGFETAKEGFERRAKLVAELKPTVILAAYGMNESFAGKEGLARFEEGLRAMLDSVAPTGARVVLVSPIGHENLGPPLPDPEAHNVSLRLYRDAMARVAGERGGGFVDLLAYGIGIGAGPGAKGATPRPRTVDGIHLNARGYEAAASLIGFRMRGGAMPLWSVTLGARGGVDTQIGVRVSRPERMPGRIRFEALSDRLPDPRIGAPAPDGPRAPVDLAAPGLEPGVFALTVDGREVARATHEGWDLGVPIARGPDFDQAEALRRAIVAKNRLLFYRLRPQNETYIYGFRKHEQGQNAVEIPRFDPLVEQAEAEIARLKKPVPHTYELIRVEEAK